MPARNAEAFIGDAIDSILSQTFERLELIVVDDGSTDSTAEIARGWASRDGRVEVISREAKGLSASLNEGVQACRGRFIARMDADDISLPFRIQRQVSELERLRVDVIGAWIRYVGGSDNGQIEEYPTSDADIKFRMLLKSALAHPAVLARASVFRSYPYSSEFESAEDYELWTRMAIAGVTFANIPEVCLLYRVHEGQVTSKSAVKQIDTASEVAGAYGAALFSLRPGAVKDLRFGMRHGASADDIIEWSLMLTRIAKASNVTPKWVERALFAVAGRCDWAGLKLLKLRGCVRREFPEAMSGRLTALYASKAIPWSSSERMLRMIRQHRNLFGVRW